MGRREQRLRPPDLQLLLFCSQQLPGLSLFWPAPHTASPTWNFPNTQLSPRRGSPQASLPGPHQADEAHVLPRALTRPFPAWSSPITAPVCAHDPQPVQSPRGSPRQVPAPGNFLGMSISRQSLSFACPRAPRGAGIWKLPSTPQPCSASLHC